MNTKSNKFVIVVPCTDGGTRLDRWIAANWPELSRARVQELLAEGHILVNGKHAKASLKLRGGEQLAVEARQRPPLRAEAEFIPLDVLFEDDDLLIVNKPAGMSVHAGAGNTRGTLVNALLGRGQHLSRGGAESDDPLRPGIVHRLDKETSGVIVVAKNDLAHARLAESFRSRAVKKSYIALAEGKLERSAGKIDFPIGRDPVHRTRMKSFIPSSKLNKHLPPGHVREALTEWRRLADFAIATLLHVQLHTGRTHQIRVHLSAVKHPLVGDLLYGAAQHLSVGKNELPALPRQFLHAAKLGFPHPATGDWIEGTAPLPEDLRDYLDTLAAATGISTGGITELL